jgi:hypothetical protein
MQAPFWASEQAIVLLMTNPLSFRIQASKALLAVSIVVENFF